MAYRPLLGVDRTLIAWEWLRRSPNYRAAALRALKAENKRNTVDQAVSAEHWGLHAFEPPDLSVPEARPIWSAAVNSAVLGVDAKSGYGEDVFILDQYREICKLVTAANGREHLLLCDGRNAIRIDILSGSIASGPAELLYRLSGLASAERPVLTLRRFLGLWRMSRFSRSLHPNEPRARRWLLMLRAYDALAVGAGQREIAALLISSEASEPRWRSQSPSLRSQVQRLVREARRMALGGYLDLLR